MDSLLVPLFVIIIVLLLAFPFMWAWNYAVVAALTVAKPIGFWHAVVLMWVPFQFMTWNGGKK